MSAPSTRTGGSWWQVWRWPLHWQIFLGLAVGAALGLSLGAHAISQIPQDTPPEQRGVVGGGIVRAAGIFALFDLGADLFLRALFLIIVPLITTSIILAVARIGGQHDFGRLGLKALGFYLCTTLAAVLLGLALMNLFTPGTSDGMGILQGQDLSAFTGAQAEVDKRVEGRALEDFLNVFRTMIPDNLVGAAVEGNFLGLIVVALVVGYFTSHLVQARRETFLHLIEAVYDLTLMVTNGILRFAPIGVLFLIARTFAEQHATLWPDGRFAEFITGIATFAGLTLVGLLVHLFGTMAIILATVARVNPLRHYRAMAPALITAFSTASSSATLPVTLECVEKRAGVSPRIGGFVIPLAPR